MTPEQLEQRWTTPAGREVLRRVIKDLHEEGAGKLNLADLTEEGASLVALQTRQALGINSLAIAGQSEQSILQLFR